MRRTYIPFYLNKADNCTLYYDYKKDYFFKSSGVKKGSIKSLASGTLGVIMYSYFKDSLLYIGTENPLAVVGISILSSCLLALIGIILIQIAMKKQMNQLQFVEKPSNANTLEYIEEGRKWLKSSLFFILYFFLFLVVTIITLYFTPLNGLMFISNTILWAIFFFMVWVLRPFKRLAIYSEMKKEILKGDIETDV